MRAQIGPPDGWGPLGHSREEARTFSERIRCLGLTGADVLALAGVEAHRAGPGNVLIRCPNPEHEDRDPSCSVDLEQGRAHCFACRWRAGDVVALHHALAGTAGMGEALRDLEERRGIPRPRLTIRPPKAGSPSTSARPRGAPEVVATWAYREADGTPAFEVQRVQYRLRDGSWEIRGPAGKPRKSYRQAHPGGSPCRLPSSYTSGKLRPLYRLPALLEADARHPVFVVEGEPAADALVELGEIATTSSGGACNATGTDWRPLAGRTVLIWPDNDPPGHAYGQLLVRMLSDLSPAPDVRVLDVDALSLPPGGDAVDWARRLGGDPR